MIKAIIFDFGSVLFKTQWEGINKDFLEKFGFSILLNNNSKHIQIYRNSETGKTSLKDFFIAINPDLDHEEIIEFYKESYKKNKHLNHKLITLIKELKKNFILYGFTDTIKEHFEVNKEQEFFNNFKKVFASFIFKKRKAEPEAFHDLTKNIEFHPSECIFIDDYLPNIENAKAAGFKVIHYPDFPDIKKLKEEINIILKKN